MKTGNQLRDEGTELVYENNILWSVDAYWVIYDLARKGLEFTSDEVWKRMTYLPDNNSAMGAVFRKAVSDKIIEPTGSFITSSRPSAHSRPIRVWKGI
jgi:hypothetical protein